MEEGAEKPGIYIWGRGRHMEIINKSFADSKLKCVTSGWQKVPNRKQTRTVEISRKMYREMGNEQLHFIPFGSLSGNRVEIHRRRNLH